MSAHSEPGSLLAVSWPRTSPETITRMDRIGALLYRGSLATLAVLVVTNGGAVIAERSGFPVTESLIMLIGVQAGTRMWRRWRDGLADLSHLRAFVAVYGAYLAAALASTLWAYDTAVAFSGVVDLATNMAIAAVLVVAIRDERDVRWILAGLLGGAAVIAVMTTYQTVTGSFDNDFLGFARAAVSGGDDTGVDSFEEIRAAGPFEDPNFFAQMMVSIVPLAAAVALLRLDRRVRIGGALLTVLMAVTVVVTLSRGALLALVAIAAAMVYRYRSNRMVVRAAVALALLSVFLLPGQFAERLGAVRDIVTGGGAAASADESLQGRTSEMRAAVLMFLDRPAGGIGYANYPELYLEYSPRIGLDTRREMRETHSLYLEVLSETGILGFGVLIIGLALARGGRGRASGAPDGSWWPPAPTTTSRCSTRSDWDSWGSS
jgi:putative inorganic carbon (HCO3(-)) transporter